MAISSRLREWGSRGLARARRSELLREFAYYSTATVLWQGARFIVFMVAAKLLGPSRFGLWQGMILILSYGPCLQLGVLNGMNRDVPVFSARGLHEKVEEVYRNVFSFVALAYGLAAFAPFIAVTALPFPEDVRLPLALMGPLLLVHMVYSYFLTYLRSAIRFDVLSRQQLLYAGVLPCVVLPMTVWLGLVGFVAGQIVAGLIMCGYLLRARKVQLVLRVEWGVIRRLIGTGLPILSVALLYEVFATIDRWVILYLLDTRQLGYYSLGIMVAGMVRLLPKVVGEQLYPRMSQRFGETGDATALRPLVLRQMAMTLALVSVVAAACTLVIPPLVWAYYPEYGPGIPAMLILCWGLLAVVPRSGLGNMLVAVGRQKTYLVLLSAVLPPALLVIALPAKLGYGINGVACGLVLSNAGFSFIMLFFSWRLLRGSKPLAG